MPADGGRRAEFSPSAGSAVWTGRAPRTRDRREIGARAGAAAVEEADGVRGISRRWIARLALIFGATAQGGCSRDEPAQPEPAPEVAAPGRVEITAAPEGSPELAELVRDHREKAKRERRDLIVYVGASWCEPCTRFHKAAEAGELDKELPSLRLLEFNLDRDRERLDQAGYGSKMIPLFAVPGGDGRASPLRIEGSVKGEQAVDEIVPRLQALLTQARALPR
jgi:hypothetical protein